jgi:hypothetical protein
MFFRVRERDPFQTPMPDINMKESRARDAWFTSVFAERSWAAAIARPGRAMWVRILSPRHLIDVRSVECENWNRRGEDGAAAHERGVCRVPERVGRKREWAARLISSSTTFPRTKRRPSSSSWRPVPKCGGSNRSGAWIPIFSSTLNTAACCGGLRYSTINVGGLLLKLRIVAGHVSIQTVRSHFGLCQNSLHCRPAGPTPRPAWDTTSVCCPPMAFLLRPPDHARLHRRCRSARLADLMPALQAFDTELLETALPLRHGRRTCAQLAFDLAIGRTVGQRRNDARGIHHRRADCAIALNLQLFSLASLVSAILDHRPHHNDVPITLYVSLGRPTRMSQGSAIVRATKETVLYRSTVGTSGSTGVE